MSVTSSVGSCGNTLTVVHTAAGPETLFVSILFGTFIGVFPSSAGSAHLDSETPTVQVSLASAGDTLSTICPNGYGLVGITIQS
jgi:hypothetical protein